MTTYIVAKLFTLPLDQQIRWGTPDEFAGWEDRMVCLHVCGSEAEARADAQQAHNALIWREIVSIA